MHLSEHTLLGFGSCGVITTFSNVHLQITREPMVLPYWYQKSCHSKALETPCSPSLVYFHKVEASSSWCLREMEDEKVLDEAVTASTLLVFMSAAFGHRQLCLGYFVRRCCNCRWYRESSYFYQRDDEPFLTVIEFFREYAETDLVKLLCLELPHFIFGGCGNGTLVMGTASHLGVGPALLKGRHLHGQYLLFCQ